MGVVDSSFRILRGALQPARIFVYWLWAAWTSILWRTTGEAKQSPLLNAVAMLGRCCPESSMCEYAPSRHDKLPVPVVCDRLASSVRRRDLWEWLGASKAWLHHFLQCSHRMPFRLWILWEITCTKLSWRVSCVRWAYNTTGRYWKVMGFASNFPLGTWSAEW